MGQHLLETWTLAAEWAAQGGLVELLKALAAPIVAFAALRVSQQQVRINGAKFRLDMYERRIKIYKSVRDLLNTLADAGKLSADDLGCYRDNTAEVDFLFDASVCEYVREVEDKIRLFIRTERKYRLAERRDSARANLLYDQVNEIEEWFSEQPAKARTVFLPFLAPEPSVPKPKVRQWFQKKKPDAS